MDYVIRGKWLTAVVSLRCLFLCRGIEPSVAARITVVSSQEPITYWETKMCVQAVYRKNECEACTSDESLFMFWDYWMGLKSSQTSPWYAKIYQETRVGW